MAKRILCLLLTVMLVLSVFAVVPAYAEGEEAETPSQPNFYSYKFKDVDARNYVDGQVIDAAAEGEAAAAPTMTGDKTEYQFSKTYYAHNGNDPMTVYLSVKDGYLYIAFETPERVRMQYNVGVAGSHRSDSLATTTRLIWQVDGSYQNQAPIVRDPGKASNIVGATAIDTTYYMVANAYENQLQEAKIDLKRLYKLMANLGAAGKGVYDSPCVTLAFYHVGTGALYGIAEPGATIEVDSASSITHIPATIIIPDKTFNDILASKDIVGDSGKDIRNMVDGQLSVISDYAETAPKLDASIGAEEYTLKKTMPNGTIAHVSVKDGFVYVAFEYAEATASRSYFYYGLTGHSEAHSYSYISAVLKPEGTISHQSMTYRSGVGQFSTKVTSVEAFAGAGAGDGQNVTTNRNNAGDAIVDFKVANDGSKTTYEIQISIAIMASVHEEAGWSADAANTFALLIGPGLKTTNFQYSATIADLKQITGINIASGNIANPTIQLPIGCVDKYTVRGADDLEGYGQPHVDAIPSPEVRLDGVVSAGEYGAGYSYKISETVSGTTRFAYDSEYVYIGATVVDPHFKAGWTNYEARIGVLDPTDVTGAFETYMTIPVRVYQQQSTGNLYGDIQGSATEGSKPSMRVRNQTYFHNDNTKYDAAANYTTRETEILAQIPTYADGNYAVGGGFNAETNTITYEIRIPISVLKTAFGVDSISKLSYHEQSRYSADGTTTNAYFNTKTSADSGVNKALYNVTRNAFGISAIKIPANSVAAVVNLDTDMKTKDAASVRLSYAYETSGLRFKTSFDADFLANLKAYAEANSLTFEFGTIIAPNNYVETAGEFTIEALDKLDLGDKAAYVKVAANYDNPFAEKNGVKTYAGSLANIKTTNLDRDFAGIGYVQVGDMVIYSSDYTVRSVAQVAQSALDAGEFSNNAAAVEILNKLAGNN